MKLGEWCGPVLPALWEVEAGEYQAQTSLYNLATSTPKWAGDLAPCIGPRFCFQHHKQKLSMKTRVVLDFTQI